MQMCMKETNSRILRKQTAFFKIKINYIMMFFSQNRLKGFTSKYFTFRYRAIKIKYIRIKIPKTPTLINIFYPVLMKK